MTIRLLCDQGHAQDLVIDPGRVGNIMVASFLNRFQDEIAALLDGSSKLYTIQPSPRRCPICSRIVQAKVVER